MLESHHNDRREESNPWPFRMATCEFHTEFYNPRGEWAGPRGTAILGQPVAKVEQAPDTSPSSKNQFNIVVPQWGTYQILS